jgi:hypothetical protein
MNLYLFRAVRLAVTVVISACAAPAAADTPGFDRPGIAFATDTLPPGSFDIEQGLPDAARDSMDGVRTRMFSADTVLRIGILKTVEARVTTALFNRVDIDDHGDKSHAQGSGDSSLGLKAALPSRFSSLSAAVLASVTFASGDRAFSAGHPTYSLGVTGNWSVNDTQTLGLYGNVDRNGGHQTVTVSPDWNFKFSDRIGGYIEAGRSFGHQTRELDAGGGLSFMAWPTIQFDLGFLRGLSRCSTDLQAGFGVSAFFN